MDRTQPPLPHLQGQSGREHTAGREADGEAQEEQDPPPQELHHEHLEGRGQRTSREAQEPRQKRGAYPRLELPSQVATRNVRHWGGATSHGGSFQSRGQGSPSWGGCIDCHLTGAQRLEMRTPRGTSAPGLSSARTPLPTPKMPSMRGAVGLTAQTVVSTLTAPVPTVTYWTSWSFTPALR